MIANKKMAQMHVDAVLRGTHDFFVVDECEYWNILNSFLGDSSRIDAQQCVAQSTMLIIEFLLKEVNVVKTGVFKNHFREIDVSVDD